MSLCRTAPVRNVPAGTTTWPPPGAAVHVESLEQRSPYRVSLVNHSQAHDADTLLATHLDGEALSADHGSPLRLIGPGRPGVNQTKWVTRVVVL